MTAGNKLELITDISQGQLEQASVAHMISTVYVAPKRIITTVGSTLNSLLRLQSLTHSSRLTSSYMK